VSLSATLRRTNINFIAIRCGVHIETFVSERAFPFPSLKVLTIFAGERFLVIFNQLFFVFFGVNPIAAGADEVGCNPAFWTSSKINQI